ncbi:MAG: thiamine pyrophosphate-binding protein [Magnetococcales bacterium]|nr:thiamine pyrophosphate-binding protein [Magnetococcales bacterium]
MIRVADYIARWLADKGVRHVFMVTGGGAMHLNDALGRHPGLSCIFNHHEQACAIAAEGYYRASGRIPLVNVTTGPGGTNAITGVFGAWTDSIPMFVVSGQVKYATCLARYASRARQLGDQEADILAMVAPITKYSALISDPRTIRHHLERAWHAAWEGRFGPVWLDVPVDVQGALVEEGSLQGYALPCAPNWMEHADVEAAGRSLLARFQEARRPVILLGTGVTRSGTQAILRDWSARMGVPLVTAWNAHDLVEDAHPCYVGRPGTVGDRAGNIAVQNADFLLVLGCRLNIRQISYSWENFADRAWIVMVDVDALELIKPTLRIDLPIHADLTQWVPWWTKEARQRNAHWSDWLSWCLERRARYPVVLESYRGNRPLNPYQFVKELSLALAGGETIVCANGSACVMTFQAFVVRPDQRLFTNSGSAGMGYDLPAAIGACLALDRQPVICLAGDGSIMMNLQELQTLVTLRLPVRIFVINNGGYHSISQTQHAYFADGLMGFNPETGVEFPDFERLAAGFGLSYRRLDSREALNATLPEILAWEGPLFCEVVVDPSQPFSPKLSARKLADGTMVSPRLENLAPFLPDAEMRDNRHPDLWEV